MTLDAKIESLLFWKAEPISIQKIARIFAVTDEDIKDGLEATFEMATAHLRGMQYDTGD